MTSDSNIPDNEQSVPKDSYGLDSELDENLIQGVTIEGYKVLGELSRGGQAVIYLATQLSTGRRVGIKVLTQGAFGSANEKSRMDREVRVLAELDHSNIVSVIDRGYTRDGWSYFVLEYIEGRILAEYMDEYRRQHPPEYIPHNLPELLRIFTRICNAVNAAHLRGIVHRDLKPSNIIIDNYREPHILDFGLATGAAVWLSNDELSGVPTITGEFLGSIPWASPEQVEGGYTKLDTRSDVYSLGVLLYEMLTGEFPYDVFTNVPDALENIRRTKPKPLSKLIDENIAAGRAKESGKLIKISNPISSTLDAIVLKSLSKDPKDRYQSAGEFANDVTRFLTGSTTVASESQARFIRPLPILAMFIVFAALTSLFLYILPSRTPTPKAALVTPEAQALGENILGYRTEGDSIVFVFDPADYQVLRLENGFLGSLNDMPELKQVNVTGPFNEWEMGHFDWTLKKTGSGVFELKKPITLFYGQATWPFKFVLNNRIWVSAPEKASNKEIVVEDMATYNLLLLIPGETEKTASRILQLYRTQIEDVWPGQGANLAVDENLLHHFLLTRVPGGTQVLSLNPLRGIPLASLDLGEAKVADFGPLKSMNTLRRLIFSDTSFDFIMSETTHALEKGNYKEAQDAVQQFAVGFEHVPAIDSFRQLMMEGVTGLSDLWDSRGTIPSHARTHNGHHYLLSPLPLTWKSADAFCQKHGAHIATITDEAEQTWIAETFGVPSLGRNIWLGASDRDTEGSWAWVTSEAWDYQHWHAVEPSNHLGQEHHLSMKPGGFWNDADGETHRYMFIIEWDR